MAQRLGGVLQVFTGSSGTRREYGLLVEPHGRVSVRWSKLEQLAAEADRSTGRDIARALIAVRDGRAEAVDFIFGPFDGVFSGPFGSEPR